MRIVIAEDSVLLREGLVGLLTAANHEVVAAVGDPGALIEAVTTLSPDIAIVDVRMPPTFTDEGIRAAITLRREDPETRILVLSQVVSQKAAAQLLASGEGGIGYLLKDRVGDVGEFLAALDTMTAGGEVIDPRVVRKLLQRKAHIDQLTARETEVLALIAEGKANAAIARELFISDAAVAKHINRIFAKLDLRDDDATHRRVQAVLTYLQS